LIALKIVCSGAISLYFAVIYASEIPAAVSPMRNKINLLSTTDEQSLISARHEKKMKRDE